MPESPMIETSWFKAPENSVFRYLCYGLSLGVLPITLVFLPDAELDLFYTACSPEDATCVIMNTNGQTHISKRINYCALDDASEGVISVEVNCVRYYGCRSTNYALRQLPETPYGFNKYIFDSPGWYIDDTSMRASVSAKESMLLKCLYGDNKIELDGVNAFNETVKISVHPIMILLYLSVAIWMYQEYWGLAIFFILAAVYAINILVENKFHMIEKIRDMGRGDVYGKFNVITAGDAEGGDSEVIETVDSGNHLTVGQRIVIKANMNIPCDCIVVKGTVVVNESRMTGESMPITKRTLEPPVLSACQDKVAGDLMPMTEMTAFNKIRDTDDATLPYINYEEVANTSILYRGTSVTTAVGDAEAVVYKTSYSTQKGNLMKTLQEVDSDESANAFYYEMVVILIVSVVLSLVMFFAVSYTLYSDGATGTQMTVFALDTITNGIPATIILGALIATFLAIYFLTRKGISVSEPAVVNKGGYITTVAFDKTGTLTKDYLQFIGSSTPDFIVRYTLEQQGNILPTSSTTEPKLVRINIDNDYERYLIPPMIAEVMATCHNLSVIERTYDHSRLNTQEKGINENEFFTADGLYQIVGDSLELALFNASGWVLHPPSQSTNQLMCAEPPVLNLIHDDSSTMSRNTGGVDFDSPFSSMGNQQRAVSRNRRLILRTFEFNAYKMRAGCLIRRAAGEIVYYVKGSPEVIVKLCKPSSISTELKSHLLKATREGKRVIAIAFASYKNIDTQKVTQEQLESEGELIFGGLLYLSNELRSDSLHTVNQLTQANLNVCMITGDHVYTAVTVARKCGIFGKVNTIASDKSSMRDDRSNSITASGHGASGHGMSRSVPRGDFSMLGRSDSFTASFAGSRDNFSTLSATTGKKQTLVESFMSKIKERVYIIDCDDETGLLMIIDTDMQNANIPASIIFNNNDPKNSEGDKIVNNEFNPAGLTLEVLLEMAASSKAERLRANLKYSLDPTGSDYVQDTIGGFGTYNSSFSATHNSYGTIAADLESNSLLDKLRAGLVALATTSKAIAYVRKHYDVNVLYALIHLTRVFARTKPDDKNFIVKALMNPPADMCFARSLGEKERMMTNEGDHVLFCGDGANDMLALRGATIGLSLCEVDTSIAAPVTAKDVNPSAVLDVLKQGRYSLATTYVIVHYNILACWLFLLQGCICFWYASMPSDSMYIITFGLLFNIQQTALCTSPATEGLSSIMPSKTYSSPWLMYQLLAQMALFTTFISLAMIILTQMSFYSEYTTDDVSVPLSYDSYEVTVTQLMVCGQMTITMLVSDIGEPFRIDWVTNPVMVWSLVVCAGWVIYQCFAGDTIFATSTLTLVATPASFGSVVLGLLVANGICSVGVKQLLDEYYYTQMVYQGKVPLWNENMKALYLQGDL